ncbi:hypothetical protein BKA58DRAFT_387607 [Alternaria rosae]|uniref:uncharacterized protein n=1 Tax=Alternaria rosae TaxID=1187941 RepID=UPI001E8CF142|nr:uncharacterized protein BKA58DRAFT_387607 [Alternaria rosae]KAH6868799.1 hypothetical protein BKA58DRAFT_387607 [Alternaria rosae]
MQFRLRYIHNKRHRMWVDIESALDVAQDEAISSSPKLCYGVPDYANCGRSSFANFVLGLLIVLCIARRPWRVGHLASLIERNPRPPGLRVIVVPGHHGGLGDGSWQTVRVGQYSGLATRPLQLVIVLLTMTVVRVTGVLSVGLRRAC